VFFGLNKTITLFLVIALTVGSVIPFGRTCETACSCSSSAECTCCAAPDQKLPKQGCCHKSPIATVKSCCSETRDALNRHDDASHNVCSCSHREAAPIAPQREQKRDHSQTDLTVANDQVAIFARPQNIPNSPSTFDGIDPGLAQMTHTRRQSLLCSWLI
jgi:hypothetical protein